MSLPNPVALSDYALAAVTLVLGLVLVLRSRGRLPVTLWGLAFVALALSGALAGFWHAHEHDGAYPEATLAWIWRVNEWGIALFGLGVVAGSARAALSGLTLCAALTLAVLVAFLFVVWTWNHPAFRYVIALDVMIMLTVLAIHLGRLRHEAATPWIVAGILVSALAAGIQAGGTAILGIDHNTLFHLVQLAAMLLLFAGAQRLRAAPSTFPAGLPK